MKQYILQTNSHDCGFTVLKVLLAKIRNDESYLMLQSPKNHAFSMLDIKRIANSYGVNLEGMKLLDFSLLKKIPNNSICLMTYIGGNHFVLLEKIHRKKVDLFDPSIGEMCISHDEFLERFSGVFLEVTEVRNIRKEKKKKHFDMLGFFDFSAQITSFLSIWGVLRYLDEVSWKLLLFILLSGVCWTLQFLIKIIRMKKFDKKYPPSKENYMIHAEAKKVLFSNQLEWPRFASLLLTELLFLMNDYRYAFVFVGWIILGFSYAIFEKKRTKYVHYLERIELEAKTENEFKMILKKVYPLEIFHQMVRLFYIGIIFLITYFYMHLCNVLSFNSLVFHGIFGLYFVESIMVIFTMDERQMKRRTTICKFEEKFHSNVSILSENVPE